MRLEDTSCDGFVAHETHLKKLLSDADDTDKEAADESWEEAAAFNALV